MALFSESKGSFWLDSDPGITAAVIARLPRPILAWWQPSYELGSGTLRKLHALRIGFVRSAYYGIGRAQRYHDYRGSILLRGLDRIRALQPIQTNFAHRLLSNLAPLATPGGPLLDPIVAKFEHEALDHLDTTLSRYVYLTHLRDPADSRFVYPLLRNRYSNEDVDHSITVLGSIFSWILCFTSASELKTEISECIEEVYGGEFELFVQWCHEHLAENVPFSVVDQALRPCLLSFASSAGWSGINCET